ncbi:MAG: PilW family protein [Candidatus Rifleibacteriota bacterium]
MNKMTGFTLIEVMIGVLIVSLVIGGFIMGMRAFRSQIEFGDKHISTLVCSQKVIEDLNEELWINPKAFDTLGISNSKRVLTPIVRDESPFFSDLEFKLEGKGNSAKLTGIDDKQTQLYSQVEDLNLDIGASRVKPKTANAIESNLYNSEIIFKWGKHRNKAGSEICSLFFSPVTPKNISLSDISDIGLDDTAYSKILTSPGGYSDVLANLADIYRFSRAFLNSDFYKTTFAEIKELRNKSAGLSYPSRALYECHKRMGNLWLDVARRSLQFLFALEPSLNLFVSGYSTGTLGADFSGENAWQLQSILTDVCVVYSTFLSSLKNAEANFRFLVSEKMASYKGVRVQYFLLAQVIDLNRVLAILPNYSAGFSRYMGFLASLEKFSKGRTPSLERLINQEKTNSTSAEKLAQNYPNLKLLSDFLNNKLYPAMQFIQSGGCLSK